MVCLPDNDANQLSLVALRVMAQADRVLAQTDIDEAVLAQARLDAPRQRLAMLDPAALARVAAAVAAGERVLLLWPDTTALPALQQALAAAPARAAVIELIECRGAARRVDLA